MIDLLWQYVVLFTMSAIPWIEILIVIPLGVGMGLSPFWVGTVSFAGNFLPVILIVCSLNWFQKWPRYIKWNHQRKRRKVLKRQEKRLQSKVELEPEENGTSASREPIIAENERKSRKNRAASIFNKYGLPGLAALGPLVIGVHIAVIIALSFNVDKLRTTVWMGASLLVWTLFLTIASYYSIDWITGLF